MKSVVSSTIILFWSIMMLVGCAGIKPIPESERTFQQVVEAPGFTKNQIYSQVKIWIAENFKSAKSVIEHDDSEAGTLIGNGTIDYPCKGIDYISKGNWKVHFTMRVDVKEGKFRQTFSNLILSMPSSYSSTFGYQKGTKVPVSQQGDIDRIKPRLLGFGHEIAISLTISKTKEDW